MKSNRFTFLVLLLLLWMPHGAKSQEFYLIPTPKEYKMSTAVTFSDSRYRLSDNFSLADGKIAAFKKLLSEQLGWSENASGTIHIQLQRLPKKMKSSEYYTLDIAENAISIASAEEPGIMRGLARLRAIITTPLLSFSSDGKASLPKISIKDWPDIDARAAMFSSSLAQLPGISKEYMINHARKFINAAAALQYNYILFDVGGRLKCERYPEINQPGPLYSKAEMSALITQIENLGMVALPKINSLGHMGGAPLVCPIMASHHRTKKIVPYTMNISHPDFWKKFLYYIDEIRIVFKNPPYFSIGTDEFHNERRVIEKNTGIPYKDFYPDFVNRVNRHLRPFGIKTVVYHDMLGPGGRHPYPQETLNGPKTAPEALRKMDKDINIDYWNYFHSHNYPFIADLQKAGFKQLILSSWFGAVPTHALFKEAYNIGAAMVVATNWRTVFWANGFIHASEYAWNIRAEVTRTENDFRDLSDAFFYSRSNRRPVINVNFATLQGGTEVPAAFKQKFSLRFGGMTTRADGIPIKLSGMKIFSAPELTPPPEVKQPCDWKKLHKEGLLSKLMISSSSSPEAIFFKKNVIFNQERGRGPKARVIYDSSYGKSTKTNRRGFEFSVNADGTVNTVSPNCHQRTGDEQGNITIPLNGFAYSQYGATPFWNYGYCRFFLDLQSGDKLRISLPVKKTPRQRIQAELDPKYSNVVVFLSAMYPIPRTNLAQIKLNFVSGKSESYQLYGDRFFFGPSWRERKNWNSWMPWDMVRHGLLPAPAIEWKAPEGHSKLKSVEVRPEPNAYACGLIVLGVTQY